MTQHESPKIAYMMSRFPKITETFILTEMIAIEGEGLLVEIYPLLREQASVVHPQARPYVARAHFEPFLSVSTVIANLSLIVRRPGRYFGAVIGALWGVKSSWNFLLGTLGILPKTMKMAVDMERTGVRHIHAHFATHPAMAAMLIHKLTGIPYSFTAHGSDLHVDQTYLAEKIKHAAFAVTISRYNVDFICDHAGEMWRNKIKMIRCGIDTDLFQAAPSPSAHERFSILMVAALREVKGHAVLLRACSRLKQAGVDFECRLIGEGELEHEIRAQITDAGLDAYVTLMGPKPRDEVSSAMQEADVVVLPSIVGSRGDREGVPVVLMEAMATAKPVVSTRQSGIPELVEDGVSGFLCPAGDDEALAKALEDLAGNADLRIKMGLAGREMVEREFNIRSSAHEMASVLRDATL